MHKEGHGGAMLLAYSPFAFIFAYTGNIVALGLGFLLLGGMPMIPDIDMKLPIKHRGWTHTIWFSIGLGVLLSLLVLIAQYFVGYIHPFSKAIGPVLFAFFIGNMLVLGHLVGDIVTKMGVKPFYPYSDYKIRIDWIPFLPTRASSEIANTLFLTFGTIIFFLSVFLAFYLYSDGNMVNMMTKLANGSFQIMGI